ncbi:MAG: hypothetical protein M1829_002197 [Trizodia sp. TS-e1964]|nr:MAG: hypothetical protein M1829_002197 [Trizodia sp. TS-e1964]
MIYFTLENGLLYKPESLDVDFTSENIFKPPLLENLDLESDIGSTPLHSESCDLSEDSEDIWINAPKSWDAKEANFNSWELYLDAKYKEPAPAYLSEAGPGIFDAAMRLWPSISNGKESMILEQKFYCSCLLQLGLGRNSSLFTFNEEQDSFSQILNGALMTGFSQESVTRNSLPILVSLADAVSVLLSALESRLSVPANCIRSLLHLQELFNHPHIILSCFEQAIRIISQLNNEEEILNVFFQHLLQTENQNTWLTEILCEVLTRISRPWLEFVSGWIGIDNESGIPITIHGHGRGFVKTKQRAWVDNHGVQKFDSEYAFDPEKMPDFITEDDANNIFETGKSLRFLNSHHPEHPVARPGPKSAELEWKFRWEEVAKVETAAHLYEASLIDAIQRHSANSLSKRNVISRTKDQSPFETFGKSKSEIKEHIKASSEFLSLPIIDLKRESSDKLTNLIERYVVTDVESAPANLSSFGLPVSMSSLLSFTPIISAQARLVNSTCTQLFFKEHGLRSHLNLQRQYQLFGDGVFVSRLSHALFDPEMQTAERRPGVARTRDAMGLKLGSRENWPPASSELRLALTGVLTDSYRANLKQGSIAATTADPPGGLSFAIRNMTLEEINKCMDPHSIQALDFLHLQYRPPAPLEAILTPKSLAKYDRLFWLLLRLIRMLYVVNELYRNARRTNTAASVAADKFRIESYHFVSVLSRYIFDDGIGSTWHAFSTTLDAIETQLSSPHFTTSRLLSISQLSTAHERMLDRMLSATLLRKRQEPAMKLLEDIFALILAFSRLSNSAAGNAAEAREASEKGVRDLYSKFRRRVRMFITVCRQMSESQVGAGRIAGDSEGNVLANMLLRLEMTGYYFSELLESTKRTKM